MSVTADTAPVTTATDGGLRCPRCQAAVLDIDVRCAACGAPLSSTASHQMVGHVVLGQYRIVDVLGQGGMSVVFKGAHELTGQEVALKILPPEMAAHSQVKSRFLEEAKALAALDHPNIVHLYNFGQENGAFVLAMQFVRGPTWERMIMQAQRLPWAVSVNIAIDVLRALEYAHTNGIVHRDMKPSNVLVRDSDHAATVMDFGIAKMTKSTRLTATGQTMGTVRYMSPEQVRGQDVDLRTDIYSLGATLYESLVGETPFDGNTHFEIMTKHLSELPVAPSARGVVVPPGLDAIVMKSLQKAIGDRYADAGAFRRALEALVREHDVGQAQTLRMPRDTDPPSISTGPRPRGSAVVNAAEAAVARSTVDAGTAPIRTPRRGLWLILGAVVLAAAAGAVVYVVQGRGKGAPSAAPPVVAPPASVPYTPAAVTFAESRSTPRGMVRSAGTVPIASLEAARERADLGFATFAKANQITPPAPGGPLHVVTVPVAELCSLPTHSMTLNGKAFDMPISVDCGREGFFYRPTDRTLVLADRVDDLDRRVSMGVAEAMFYDYEPLRSLVESFKKQL